MGFKRDGLRCHGLGCDLIRVGGADLFWTSTDHVVLGLRGRAGRLRTVGRGGLVDNSIDSRLSAGSCGTMAGTICCFRFWGAASVAGSCGPCAGRFPKSVRDNGRG